jgi:hypothetical protein
MCAATRAAPSPPPPLARSQAAAPAALALMTLPPLLLLPSGTVAAALPLSPARLSPHAPWMMVASRLGHKDGHPADGRRQQYTSAHQRTGAQDVDQEDADGGGHAARATGALHDGGDEAVERRRQRHRQGEARRPDDVVEDKEAPVHAEKVLPLAGGEGRQAAARARQVPRYAVTRECVRVGG